MPKVQKTKKFALVKRMISKNDARIKTNQIEKKKEETVRHIPQVSSSLFFQHNEALGRVIHDTETHLVLLVLLLLILSASLPSDCRYKFYQLFNSK
jgi:hypothetical protein